MTPRQMHFTFASSRAEQECRVVRLNEDVALDVGPGEALVGIEILDASQVLGDGRLPVIELENLSATAAEA